MDRQGACTMIKVILLNSLLKYFVYILHQVIHVLTLRSTCFITTADHNQTSSSLIVNNHFGFLLI